jgi:hypothetical protein
VSWLLSQVQSAQDLASPEEQLQAIYELVNWQVVRLSVVVHRWAGCLFVSEDDGFADILQEKKKHTHIGNISVKTDVFSFRQFLFSPSATTITTLRIPLSFSSSFSHHPHHHHL